MTTPGASSGNVPSVSPLDGPSQSSPDLMGVSPDQPSPSRSAQMINYRALLQFARLRKAKKDLLTEVEAAKPGFATDIDDMSYTELEALEEKLKDDLLIESVKRDCTQIFVKQMLTQIAADEELHPEDSGAGGDASAAEARGKSRGAVPRDDSNRELWALTDTLKSKARKVVHNNEETQELNANFGRLQRENERLLLRTRKVYSKIEDGTKMLEDAFNTPRTDRVEIRLFDDLQNQQRMYTMRRKVLQGLITGSGIDWARDPELRETLIGLGKKSPLS